MKAKILITGGAGFIGMQLARYLVRVGYRVHIVDNFHRGRRDREFEVAVKENGITYSDIDLRDNGALHCLDKDFQAIFHLAAIVGVKNVIKRPYQVLWDNLLLLKNVIDFANNQPSLSRFLFSSTSEVYAGTLQNFGMTIPTNENTPLSILPIEHGRSSYMISKIYGEAMCHQSGLPFTIFRPHNIYGPRMGMAHVIPQQLLEIYHAESRTRIPVRSIDHTRSFCYIDDAVEMLKRMLETEACERQTLNLGTEEPELSIGEVVRKCIEVVGKDLDIESVPDSMMSPARRCPDMSRTNQIIGYRSRISIDDGIAKTWEWYKRNGGFEDIERGERESENY